MSSARCSIMRAACAGKDEQNVRSKAHVRTTCGSEKHGLSDGQLYFMCVQPRSEAPSYESSALVSLVRTAPPVQAVTTPHRLPKISRCPTPR